MLLVLKNYFSIEMWEDSLHEGRFFPPSSPKLFLQGQHVLLMALVLHLAGMEFLQHLMKLFLCHTIHIKWLPVYDNGAAGGRGEKSREREREREKAKSKRGMPR